MDKRKNKGIIFVGLIWILISLSFISSTLLYAISINEKNRLPLVGIIILPLLMLTASIMFIKCREWARRVLEVLTWILLTYIVGFYFFLLFRGIPVIMEQAPLIYTIIVGLMAGLMIVGFFGIPTGIMLRFLRSEELRCLMKAKSPESTYN